MTTASWAQRARVAAPGGAAYAVGDRVVTLAPAAEGRMVTSATATVVALDHRDQGLTLRTDDEASSTGWRPTRSPATA